MGLVSAIEAEGKGRRRWRHGGCMKVNVLGTLYTIKEKKREKDAMLVGCNGYCDPTTHEIVVVTEDGLTDAGDFSVYRRKIMRHEIIHAFLFESGLQENFTHPDYGHEETIVDWIAAQYPKIKKAFASVGCEE